MYEERGSIRRRPGKSKHMATNAMNRGARVLDHAPGSQRKVWEDLLADREVIERLAVTPGELDALSRVAFLGAVTCKDDFLLVLRQIRQASDSTPKPPQRSDLPVYGTPRATESRRPGSKPKTARMLNARQKFKSLPAIQGRAADPGSLGEIVRRRMPEQFGVFVFMLIVISLSWWVLCSAILSWRRGFDSGIGVPSYRWSGGISASTGPGVALAWPARTEVKRS